MSARYVTRSRVRLLAAQLSDREWQVVTMLRRIRVATSLQIEAVAFSDVSRRQARSVLASMVRRRLVARLPRVIGGVRAGSAGFVYVLDVAGLRLGSTSGRVARPWSVGSSFLSHSLAVTKLFVELVRASDEGQQLVDFRGEPACWRTFSGPGGGRITLKPDAEVVMRSGGFEDWWFIEVDRGTESRPTLARKLDRYVRYWQSGQQQAQSGVFPKVLWIVPDEARHGVLIDEFARTPVAAWPLFAVATESGAVQRIMRGVTP
jgi:hypothetical protein